MSVAVTSASWDSGIAAQPAGWVHWKTPPVGTSITPSSRRSPAASTGAGALRARLSTIVATATAAKARSGRDPYRATGNAQAVLRAIYLQLTISPRHPSVRPDLLLALVASLRRVHPYFLDDVG